MQRIWRRHVGLATMAATLLVGCSAVPNPGPAQTYTPTVISDKTPPPEPVVPNVWPLTGLEGAVVTRPAVAVKIENTSQARPQTGLENADVVWETIVEFGVSRFVAVYHSDLPDQIGPIRSIRPVDAKVAAPLGGLLVFSGGQEGIVTYLAQTPLQLLSEDEEDRGFTRVRFRRSPHNVYGSLETFLEQADSRHTTPPPGEFEFSRPGRSAAEIQGTAASEIRLSLAPGVSPRWTWSDDQERWLRSEASGPSVSADDVRLSAVNVVILEAETYDSGYDAQLGEPVPDLRLEGRGSGLLATGGKTVTVTWTKSARSDPIVLTGPDGKVATLSPGNTWVELVPLPAGTVTIT